MNGELLQMEWLAQQSQVLGKCLQFKEADTFVKREERREGRKRRKKRRRREGGT